MAKLALALISAILVVTSAIFIADSMLAKYGLDFGTLLEVLFASASDPGQEEAGFDQVNSTHVGNDTYDSLAADKEYLESAFEQAEPIVGQLNNDTDLVDAMHKALGDLYSVYLYSRVTKPVAFKVFEWTIIFEEGMISTFESGKAVEQSNVTIVADHSIVGPLLAQNYTQSQIIEWVEGQEISVRPITEIGRVLQVLPTILERLDI